MVEEDKNMEELAQEYDDSQIQVLDGLEAVRMRPARQPDQPDNQ